MNIQNTIHFAALGNRSLAAFFLNKTGHHIPDSAKSDFIQFEMLYERLDPCCITLVTLTLNY